MGNNFMSQTGYPFIKIKIFPFNFSSLKGTIKGGQMLNGKCENVSHKPSTINQEEKDQARS